MAVEILGRGASSTTIGSGTSASLQRSGQFTAIATVSTSSDLWDDLDTMISSVSAALVTSQALLQDEIKIYLSKAPIGRNGDPLKWWRNNIS